MSVYNELSITVCEDASDAFRTGFNYREPIFKCIDVHNVVVVKKGTQSGKPTVDFILVDGNGQKHVFMVTSALLEFISKIGKDE